MPREDNLIAVLDVQEPSFPLMCRQGNDLDDAPSAKHTHHYGGPDLRALGANLRLEVHEVDLS